MSADLIARLITAGTPADLVAEVAMALGGAAADQRAIAERREKDAARQRVKRAADAASRDIHGRNVMSRDIADEAPAPDKSLPQTPSKINPTPGVCIAPAREADPGSDTAGDEIGAEAPKSGSADPNTSAEEIAAAEAEAARLAAEQEAERLRKRWKDMPPPPGVSDVQWRGFLDHRKARRQSLTFRAYQLLCGKLEALAAAGWPPGDLIDLAVERGWLTVFEPKNERPPNGQQSRQNRPAEFTNPMAAAAARYLAQDPGEGRPNLGDPGY